MKVDFDYNITEIRELAKKYPEVAKEETIKVMDIVVTRLESEVERRTPKGVGGAAGLAGSIFGETVSQTMPIKGVVGTPLEYGEVVEKGRRPGKFPPVEPIALWARRKLGVSEEDSGQVGFLIARKIAMEGFEGAHMFEEAWRDTERWAQGQLASIPRRIIRRIEGGA